MYTCTRYRDTWVCHGMSIDATNHPLVMILWHLGTNFGGTPRMDTGTSRQNTVSLSEHAGSNRLLHLSLTVLRMPKLAILLGFLTVNQPIWYAWEAMQTCSGQLQNSLEYLSGICRFKTVNIRNANMNQQQFSVDSVSAPASGTVKFPVWWIQFLVRFHVEPKLPQVEKTCLSSGSISQDEIRYD